MKKIIKVLAVVVGIFILVGVTGLIFATRGLEEGKAVTIESVNIAELEDGIYEGEYDYKRWENQVEVTVKNGEIIDIQLVDGFKHQEALEKIYDRVLMNQSLSVDTVSGATVSSNAYLKAIESALKSTPVK